MESSDSDNNTVTKLMGVRHSTQHSAIESNRLEKKDTSWAALLEAPSRSV